MKPSASQAPEVPLITQVTDAVRGRQSINPKTVLGFYATVLGLLGASVVGVVAALAANNVQTRLIAPLLIFAGALLVLLLVGVFVVTLIDPAKLMLTQVSGTEYVAIQRRTIVGDSLIGERVEIVGLSPGQMPAGETPMIEAGTEEEASSA